MKNQRGFTLVELAVTMAVIAILGALAAPNIIAWRANAKIQTASREVLSVLQDARLQAIKRNAEVEVEFFKGEGKNGTYTVTVNSGPTTDSGRMPAGVELEDDGSITFTSRGFTKNFTTLSVKMNHGAKRAYEVEVNSVGHSKIVRG